MSQRIHLAAIVMREGRVLLHRPGGGSMWELPGGPLLPEHEDTDAGMDAILTAIGIHAPAIEEDFVETVYLRDEQGHIVYNVYGPTDWAGEPSTPAGIESGWFGLYELEQVPMDAKVREAVLAAFGMHQREDDTARILAELGAEVFGVDLSAPLFETPPHLDVPPAASPPGEHDSRREAGLDVLRSLSGGDPNALEEMTTAMPELAEDILEFSMGNVWQHPALDRRTRSLLVVAMLAALGKQGSLKSHVGGALNHGATPEQIVETLRMVAVYAGFPAAVEAWPAMEEAFAERGIARPGRTP